MATRLSDFPCIPHECKRFFRRRIGSAHGGDSRALGRRRRRALLPRPRRPRRPAGGDVVGNVGDDTELLGLHISPDLDSLLYTLADLNDEERGWGRRRETWNAHDTLRSSATTSVVPVRRPRPRPAPRAHEGAAGRASRFPRSRAHSPPGSASSPPAAGDRRPAAHDRRDAGRDSRSRSGSSARPRGQGRRPALRGRRVRPARAGRARGDRAGVARRDRAEQPVHLDLADPRRVGDPRDRPAQARRRSSASAP